MPTKKTSERLLAWLTASTTTDTSRTKRFLQASARNEARDGVAQCSVLKGMLHDTNRWDEFCDLVKPLGTPEQQCAAAHARQREFDVGCKAKRERESDALLLPDAATDVVQSLTRIRGVSGSREECARFSDHAMEVLAIGQRVAASASAKRMKYQLGAEGEQ